MIIINDGNVKHVITSLGELKLFVEQVTVCSLGMIHA